MSKDSIKQLSVPSSSNHSISVEPINSETFRHLFVGLNGLKSTDVTKYLRRNSIVTAVIREELVKEGETFRHGILLMAGSVLLLRQGQNSQQVCVSEIAHSGILNPELYSNGYVSKYTLVVSSSQCNYVLVDPKLLKAYAISKADAIMERQKLQQNLFKRNNAVFQGRLQKSQSTVFPRGSLPSLSIHRSLAAQSSLAAQRQETQPRQRTKTLAVKPKIFPPGKAARRASLTPFADNALKIQNEAFLRRRKSELMLAGMGPKQDQGQRVFKELVKKIIHRKLVYEKKQCSVLNKSPPKALHIDSAHDKINEFFFAD